MTLRRVAAVAGAILLAVLGVAVVIAVLTARDSGTVRPAAGPGTARAAGERPAVAAGNVVLLYSDERETAALRALALDTGGPVTPALVAAGQAVLVRRRPDVRVPVRALTRERRLDAAGPDDQRLRRFVEYWLGREG